MASTKTQYLHGQSKTLSKAFINTDFNTEYNIAATLNTHTCTRTYVCVGHVSLAFALKHADLRSHSAYIHTYIQLCIYKRLNTLKRTHDSENVISMHADNKYRMMEMRKTLNQIKATTKRTKTDSIHENHKKATSTACYCSKQ